MALHRFFVPPDCIVGQRVELPADTARQIARVLRLRRGDEIVVLDDSGREFRVQLDQAGERVVGGAVVESRMGRGEPSVRITLYQALLPREKFELALQKGTEVGIARFVPVWCSRAQPGRDAANAARLERWRRIVQEAAEQSQRARIPTLMPALTFAEAVAEAAREGAVLLAWEHEDRHGPRERLSNLGQIGQLSVFVGPEGGFTTEEVELAREHGALTIGLGPRVLRAETAGPLLAALALYAKGDLDAAYR